MYVFAAYVVVALVFFAVQFRAIGRSQEFRNYDPEVMGASLFATSIFWPFVAGWHFFHALFTIVGRSAQGHDR